MSETATAAAPTKVTPEPLPVLENPKTYTATRNGVALNFVEGYAKKKGESNKDARVFPLAPKVTEQNLDAIISFYGPKEVAAILSADLRTTGIAMYKRAFTEKYPAGDFVEEKFIKSLEMFTTRTSTIKELKAKVEALTNEMIEVGQSDKLTDEERTLKLVSLVTQIKESKQEMDTLRRPVKADEAPERPVDEQEEEDEQQA